MRLVGSLQTFWRDNSGASLVELVLLMPIFMGLMVGVAEYGRAMHQQHIIAKSVRDAARTMARDPRLLDPATGDCTTTIDANLQAQTENIALRGSVNTSDPYLISYWDNPATEVVITVQCIAPSGLESPAGEDSSGNPRNIPVVTVEGVVPFDDIGLLSIFGFSAPTLRTEHVQMGVGL